MAGGNWGVIFDLDGVVVDTAALHEAAWRGLAQEHGRTLPAGFFERNFGERNEVTVARLFDSPPAAEARRLIERRERIFAGLIERGLPPAAGAEELIRSLRGEGARVALLTAEPRGTLRRMAMHVPLSAWFDVLVDADDVTAGKPAPDGLVLAAGRLGLPPSDCIALDDAEIGIVAAHRAGMKCVWVRAGGARSAPANIADLVVDDLSAVTAGRLRTLSRAEPH